MPNKTDDRFQGSKYDKILRENMPLAMPGIMKNVLGLNIMVVHELKDKIQITRQKEVDALRVVTDVEGNTFILHVEFESKNKPKMNFRMAEYRCMLHQIHDYPIRQYVIYLSKTRLTTPYRIDLPGLRFEYTLISISEVPYHLFLSSGEPEEQILTVLANFGDEDPTEVIKEVLVKLRSSSGELTDNKYYEQLRVILQMRNLEEQTDKAMESVNTFFKIERDTLYKWGRKAERAKAQEEKKEMARKMLLAKEPLEKITEYTGLSMQEIKAL